MTILQLDGLIGSHPLGALAAFGLLKVLTSQGGKPRLSFVELDDWVGQLESEHDTIASLVEALSTWIVTPREEVLAWTTDDVRVEPEVYRQALARSLTANHELTSFLVAFAADGAEDKSKGLVKPSGFYMASGQQSFLEAMRAILALVREAPQAAWSEAIRGPWRYTAPLWGAGWDPGTERMHALRYKAPTKDKTSCVAGAVWLGLEALPLFPSFSRRGRERTVGFVSHSRGKHWRWPVPTAPLDLDSLSLLLASHEVAMAPKMSLRPGVGAIYESTRHEFGQGYAVFRPARRIQ
jgi:hypothetical protein